MTFAGTPPAFVTFSPRATLWPAAAEKPPSRTPGWRKSSSRDTGRSTVECWGVERGADEASAVSRSLFWRARAGLGRRCRPNGKARRPPEGSRARRRSASQAPDVAFGDSKSERVFHHVGIDEGIVQPKRHRVVAGYQRHPAKFAIEGTCGRGCGEGLCGWLIAVVRVQHLDAGRRIDTKAEAGGRHPSLFLQFHNKAEAATPWGNRPRESIHFQPGPPHTQ